MNQERDALNAIRLAMETIQNARPRIHIPNPDKARHGPVIEVAYELVSTTPIEEQKALKATDG